MSDTKTLLLDADIVAYKFASLAEKPTHWGDGLWTLHAWEEPTIVEMEDYLHDLAHELDGEIVVCLSDDENFRKRVLPTYKGNRKDTRKPMLLPFLKDYLALNYRSYKRPELEGDDLLGILMTSMAIEGEKVMVSIDKDMKTVPGAFINADHRDRGVLLSTLAQADYAHMYQTLIGDATDGYAGCPGIGPKKAVAILEPFTDGEERPGLVDRAGAWARILEVYEKAKLGPEEALTQARVARILRASDYDFKAKAVKLWNPPQ